MRTTFVRGALGEQLASLATHLGETADGNQNQLERLQRNLACAIRNELTGRQREILLLYYSEGLKMYAIGERLGVNRSTVSRTLSRATKRLERALRYSL